MFKCVKKISKVKCKTSTQLYGRFYINSKKKPFFEKICSKKKEISNLPCIYISRGGEIKKVCTRNNFQDYRIGVQFSTSMWPFGFERLK